MQGPTFSFSRPVIQVFRPSYMLLGIPAVLRDSFGDTYTFFHALVGLFVQLFEQ